MSITATRTPSTNRVVVGIADMKLSRTPGDVLTTYALGSCLGICIYDPLAKVAGMLHAMLPSAASSPERAQDNPERFVDTGVPKLFKAAYELGARKERIVVRVAGGAAMNANGSVDSFQIGKRNFVELKKILWKNGVVITDEDVGGSISRTVTLDVATGEVRIKSGTNEYALARQFPRDEDSGSRKPCP